MHGLPNIQRAGSTVRKVFWGLLTLGGLCVMTWQITLAVIKYQSNPTETTVKYDMNSRLDFPAVTICNLNPLRMSALTSNNAAADLKTFLDGKWKQWEEDSKKSKARGKSRRRRQTDNAYEDTGYYENTGDAGDTGDTGMDYGGRDGDTMGSDYGMGGPQDQQYGSYGGTGEYGDYGGTGGRGDHGNDYDNDLDNDPPGQNPGNEDPPEGTWVDPGAGFEDVWEKQDYQEDFTNQEDFLALSSQINRKDRLEMGHQLSSMLTSCTFRGKQCTESDFKLFNNFLYGNCFVFNSGSDGTIKTTNKVGPRYGLTMELYIEQSEYTTGFSDAAGIRVLIHNQTDMPFPEDDGVSIAPGVKSSIGISKRTSVRAIPPWGPCKDHTAEENAHLNAYLQELEHISYSDAACKKTCLQKAVIDSCHCYDPNIPYSPEVEAFENLNIISKIPPCSKTSLAKTYKECVRGVERMYINDTLGCNEKCAVACTDTRYSMEASYSAWPAQSAVDRFSQQLSGHSQYFYDMVHSEDSDKEKVNGYIKSNIAKVEVYFKEMVSEKIVTSPSYLMLDLVSDFGGQAGLWVGVSMIAIFELFELIIDLTLIVVKKYKKRNTSVSSNNISNSTNQAGLPHDSMPDAV